MSFASDLFHCAHNHPKATALTLLSTALGVLAYANRPDACAAVLGETLRALPPIPEFIPADLGKTLASLAQTLGPDAFKALAGTLNSTMQAITQEVACRI